MSVFSQIPTNIKEYDLLERRVSILKSMVNMYKKELHTPKYMVEIEHMTTLRIQEVIQQGELVLKNSQHILNTC